MILIDSNVPMYLVGASHPHKADAQRLLVTPDGKRLLVHMIEERSDPRAQEVDVVLNRFEELKTPVLR